MDYAVKVKNAYDFERANPGGSGDVYMKLRAELVDKSSFDKEKKISTL